MKFYLLELKDVVGQAVIRGLSDVRLFDFLACVFVEVVYGHDALTQSRHLNADPSSLCIERISRIRAPVGVVIDGSWF